MNRFYSLLQCAAFVLLLLGTGALPAFAQRPTALDLGQVSCGDTKCDALRIPSLAEGERIIRMTFRDGTFFEIDPFPALPLWIPNNDAVSVQVCFTPPGRGAFEDSLMVVVSDSVWTGTDSAEVLDTAWVKLTGVGIGPALNVSPLQITFPRTDVSAVSASQQITLRNDGEEMISLTAADFAGIVAPFQIVNPPAFPLDIAPGASVLIEVQFAPTVEGHRSAYTDIATGCSEFARLELKGQTPNLIHKGFGEVACDDMVCDTLYVPATNVNDIILSARTRDDISFTIGAGFSPPVLIPSGDSIGIPICFSPSRRGTIVDSLLIVVNRSGSKLDSIRVRLTGVGIGPLIDISPIVLNFPKTSPPATSTLSTFFTNNGERPLLLTAGDLPIPAPFRLVSPALPIEIQPGETIEFEIEFVPVETGVFSVPVDIAVGCTRVLQIGLNGSTDFIGTGGVLRVSKVGFNPANNERVACDVSQCTEVTLSNVGNASLRIEDLDWVNGTLGYYFSPVPATPFIINPNETRTINICIDATRAGTLQDTLLITSNDRRSIAFGIVLDASRSMILDSFLCSTGYTLRLTEAKRQAQIFIDNTLLYLPALGIQDQIVITHFSNNPVLSYPLTFVNDVTRADARNSISAIAALSGTWTGQALVDMIARVKLSPLPDRVIVLLADGETADLDQLNFPLNTIINQARAENIRIFTIGIALDQPGARGYLDAMADQTNGASFYTDDCSSLGTAFAEITEIVSQGGVWREPFQITVTAPQIVAENIRFDSLYIYDDTCVTLTLTNVGEGEALVSDVQFTDLLGGATAEFFLESGVNAFPIKIPENEQRQVRICFRPEQLRERSALTQVFYNSCAGDPSAGELNGTGYAIANLRIDDERVTLPGGSVTLPIYGDTSLSTYGVDTIVWAVRWNRTMLELTGVAPGAQANGASVVQSGAIVDNGRYSSVELMAVGPALHSTGQLAELQFTMLRGDSLAAYVEITAGKFKDGNPKALLKNAGIVIYDSTCFRELKPILYKGPAAKIVISAVSPTPASGDYVNVTLDATEQGRVSLDLFDTDGTALITTEHHDVPQGSSLLTLNVGKLRSGVYHLRLGTDDGSSLYHKLIIRR